ncbi:MAG: SDR family NAD(P)-dependent oxidoreductase [Thermoguttaceae bacterium]
MKRILIIGATSGIGRSLAERYAKEGCKVGVAGRRENLLSELLQEYPENFVSIQLDVTELETLEHKLDNAVSLLGGLDLLIVSSGTGELNSELDFNVELPTIQTNILGFTSVVDWGYRYFSKQNGGHLVAITSIASLMGEAAAPAYSASKAYQANYMDALRTRTKKEGRNVIVTEIRPGLVDTAMAKGDGLFWVMPVEKVTGEIVKAIKKRRPLLYVTRRWRCVALILRMLYLFR